MIDKMKFRNIIFSLTLVAFASGCYKDDSQNFQIPLADVSIAADDAISFSVGVEGTYEPVIEWGGTSESDYDYKWTDNGREVISTERVLKHLFTEAGDHYLTFQMTDKKTGLVYGRDFKMTANSEFFLGWLVLSEGTDGSSRLSFVNLSTFQSYPDIYAKMFPDSPLGTSPVGLACYGIRKTDQVTVIQNGGAGSVVLDGSSFKKVVNVADEFIGGKFPDEDGGFAIKAIGYTHRGPDLVLTESGNIYDRVGKTGYSAAFQSAMYSTEPYISAGGPAKFTYMTFPGANSYFTPLFDGAGNRWLAYYTTTAIPVQIPAFDKGGDFEFEEGFDYCAGMSSDVTMRYAQTYEEGTMRSARLANVLEKGGSYYVNTAKLDLNNANGHVTVSGLVQKPLAEGYSISSGSRFFIPRGSGTDYNDELYVFFNVGRRVYFYHFDTGLTYLYHDFGKDANVPSGEIVSMIQNGNASQLGVAFTDGHLFICDLAKTTLTAIRQNNIDPETSDKIVKAHIDDIPGTVVSLAFKYGKADNYTGSKIAR
mgnify:CR=1 FL=1